MMAPSVVPLRARGLAVLAAFVGVVVVVASPAPSASAATRTFTFTGSGWGHGLGMSQYGAKGAAEAGQTYSSILTRFYQRTTVGSKTMPGGIRLGLVQGAKSISLIGSGRFDIDLKGTVVGRAKAGETWTMTPTSSGKYLLTLPDGTHRTFGSLSDWVGVRYESYGTLLKTGGIHYKYGWVELNISGSGTSYTLRSILHLAPFERYLNGIAEMPSSWHMEALKTQAVAARTYAVEKMKRLGVRSSCNCHVYDDTRDQVYRGYEKELASGGDRWRSAVSSTTGKVVLYNNLPIIALYHSADGGYTENNENVWRGSPYAYLRGVRDPWDPVESPYQNWKVTFTQSEIDAKLASRPTSDVGTLASITILDPLGVSGRVTPVFDADHGGVRLTGSKGAKRLSGEQLRSVLGLRSTLYKVKTTVSS
jgi:stage II sporulation protein D